MSIIDTVHARLNDLVEELEIIDESYLHESHHTNENAGAHLVLNISSSRLSKMKMLSAHREIYSKLQDLIPDKIHAVRIKII